MESCGVDKITLANLYKAVTGKDEKRKVIVPIFQRGKCWKPEDEEDFILSVTS